MRIREERSGNEEGGEVPLPPLFMARAMCQSNKCPRCVAGISRTFSDGGIRPRGRRLFDTMPASKVERAFRNPLGTGISVFMIVFGRMSYGTTKGTQASISGTEREQQNRIDPVSAAGSTKYFCQLASLFPPGAAVSTQTISITSPPFFFSSSPIPP